MQRWGLMNIPDSKTCEGGSMRFWMVFGFFSFHMRGSGWACLPVSLLSPTLTHLSEVLSLHLRNHLRNPPERCCLRCRS